MRQKPKPKFDKPTIDRAFAFGKAADKPAPAEPPAEKQPPPLPPATIELPRLVGVKAAAAALDVSRTKLHNMTRGGELPFVRIGGSVKYRVADLAAYIENHTRTEWDNALPRGRRNK